jgi:hypothetical protein
LKLNFLYCAGGTSKHNSNSCCFNDTLLNYYHKKGEFDPIDVKIDSNTEKTQIRHYTELSLQRAEKWVAQIKKGAK